MRCIVFTLTFDSSPIKGEGIRLVLSCCHPTVPPLWIADQVRNDGPGLVLSCFTLCSRVRHWDRLWSSAVKGEVGVVLFTLTFDSSPIKGEGIL